MNLASMNLSTGDLSGENVMQTVRTLGDMKGLYADEAARAGMPQDTVLYRTFWAEGEPEGTEGALLYGTTVLEPGLVGDEFFMTRGHFHALRNRAEFCLTISGEGALILMDEQRRTRMERMTPGSLHVAPGHTAHRVANTGSGPLTFLVVWPADCGHDYEEIEKNGFSRRLRNINGVPQLV
jgi:glucose-6-phosphate isomerase, archaeal